MDAATCFAAGALMTLDAAPLAPLLGLPAALLFWTGASLYPDRDHFPLGRVPQRPGSLVGFLY